MSTHEQHTPTVLTSAVRNTGGRNGPQGLEEPTPDEVLRELCDKNYHKLLPLIAEKMQKEKEQQDKLNAVKPTLRRQDWKKIKEIIKSRITPNPRRQLPEQSQKRGMEIGALEARDQRLPVYFKMTQTKQTSLHLGPRPRRRVVCAKGWEEKKRKVHLHVYRRSHSRVPTKRKPMCNQGKHHHRGTSSRETGGHSENLEIDLDLIRDACQEVTRSPIKKHRTWNALCHVKKIDGSGDLVDHLKLSRLRTRQTESRGQCNMVSLVTQRSLKRFRVWFRQTPRKSLHL
ncbi:hypothetical protein Tco_0752763 [Tanacetum coccineum]|uniref:Reverse transcriptase domain-containing protein n=1 Tax=Tanacetum coccineum TaxID=301880 RepID=A0ABQ4Z8N9_9ASTR